jgi:hypothetical protein
MRSATDVEGFAFRTDRHQPLPILAASFARAAS